MTEALQKHINRYFQENRRLSKQRLVGSIKEDFPNWSYNTISMYLSKLKKEGIINAPSRGIYELESTLLFQPKLSSKLRKMYNKIKRTLPYINFCIWETNWLNDFMHHQPFRHYLVVEVEKNSSESVFDLLSESSKNIFLNPDEKIYDLYIQRFDSAIIIKNLVSEAPLMEVQNVIIPTLEKLLVDMLIDIELFSAQQDEREIIMKSALNKFTINKLKMHRYAFRRNRENEIEKLLDISLAK